MTRKILNQVASILLLLIAGYVVFRFATATERVKAVCQQITPQMTLSALNQLADTHGLSRAPNINGTVFMVERSTFGRTGCRVELSQSQVVSAQMNAQGE